MRMRIRGLPAEHFSSLSTMTDEQLAREHAVRVRVGEREHPPCRISLTDARPGDEVLLVNYEHHPVESPYRSRFAIYVRAGEQTCDAVDSVPMQLRSRFLALRAYDAQGMLVAYELGTGQALEQIANRQLVDARAAYVHVHYAAAGCYAARIDRA
jgi:hypothetical protein